MTRKTWLGLIGAASVAALLAACGTNTSQVGSSGDPISGTRCVEEGVAKRSVDGCNTCSCSDGSWACTEIACEEECTEGDTTPAGDNCNTCVCGADGNWSCTLRSCVEPVICTPNERRQADDGCNTCTCSADGDAWVCTERGCAEPECSEVDRRRADDGCNTCVCDASGAWACTERACNAQCPAYREAPASGGCPAVVVYARDASSGACCMYPSPCEAPVDWAQFYSLEACEGAVAACPADRDPGPDTECDTAIAYAKDPATGLCCEYASACHAPLDWQQFHSLEACEGAVAACPADRDPGPDTGCDAAMAYAKDPATGLCCEYGSSCHAPLDWELFHSMEECEAVAACPGPIAFDGVCDTAIAWAKDPASGICCEYGSSCVAPSGWEQFSTQEDCESSVRGLSCGDSICNADSEFCHEVYAGVDGSPTRRNCEPLGSCNTCECLTATDLDFCGCNTHEGGFTVTCSMP